MIYLIRSYGKNESILKLGYTENIDRRMGNYFSHNPLFELISTREGDEFLETLFHYYLKSLGYRYQANGKLNEWFKDNSEILSIFDLSQEELEDKLWKNRDKAFDPKKVSSSLENCGDRVVYGYLYEKNIDSFSGEEFIIDENGNVIKQEIPQVDIEFSKIIRKKDKKILSEEKEKELLCQIKERLGSEKHNELEREVSDFLDNHFYSTGLFHEKMRMYCEFMDGHKKEYSQELQDMIYFKIKDERFRKYYNYLGTDRCRALEYREMRLRDEMSNSTLETDLKFGVRNKFTIGKSYTLKEVKFILDNLYRDLGVFKNPKATDLEEYCVLKLVKITDPKTRKRTKSYTIIDYK